MTDYRSEFPDFDPATMPAIPAEWTDISWHNDACPSFTARGEGDIGSGGWRLYVFIDYAEDKRREQRGFSRFNAWVEVDGPTNGDNIFFSDDWDAILAFVQAFDPTTLVHFPPQED